MSDTKTDQKLAQAFALLSKGAARRKVYCRKAAKEGRPEVARFLRAMSASETVQARRLFNNMIGKVDTSEDYVTTIFETEVRDILESYTELLDNIPESRPALLHAISQLRAAATRLGSFYARDSKDVRADNEAEYFVCRFCGYLSKGNPPEKCPICTAPRDAFDEILY